MIESKDWFNYKVATDAAQRTAVGMLRFLGIDTSVMLLGWLSDWKLIDLRIPVNYGIYLQVLFIVVAIGRLPTDTYEEV